MVQQQKTLSHYQASPVVTKCFFIVAVTRGCYAHKVNAFESQPDISTFSHSNEKYFINILIELSSR